MFDKSYYLSGSRWWSYHRPNSDWDYITQYTSNKRDYLLSLGFIEGFNALDDPNDGVLVMRSPDERVEIALCVNARAKLWARNTLSLIPMGQLTKKQRKVLWTKLYNFFK